MDIYYIEKVDEFFGAGFTASFGDVKRNGDGGAF